MYPAEIVKPMKDELINIGFQELLSPDAVDKCVVAELPDATANSGQEILANMNKDKSSIE